MSAAATMNKGKHASVVLRGHTGNQSHGVLSAILGGLEDVGVLDASEGWFATGQMLAANSIQRSTIGARKNKTDNRRGFSNVIAGIRHTSGGN